MDEALEALGISADASPFEKLEAAFHWHLGDPGLAEVALEWATDAGYTVLDDDTGELEGEI